MNFLIGLREFKNHLLKKENIFFSIFVIIIFFLDRLSKSYVIDNFKEVSYYVNRFINFDLTWNIGIAFSFLSTDSTLFYNLITLLIGLIILILIYIFAKSEIIDKFIYSIIIGGGLGNFYDRLIYKGVPDFIDLHYDNFHWFTFNVADIFITTGIMIYILKSFFEKK
tara:strand:+ start:112 stop:612 length:501 start_codon:yes stop_codon:yes gene_type:complete